MKKRMFERGLSLLLALVMVLALAPVFTIEAEAVGNTTPVADLSALENALGNAKSGDVIVVVEDIVVNKNLTVPSGVSLLIPYANSVTKDAESGDSTNYAYYISGDTGAAGELPYSNSCGYNYTVSVDESVHFQKKLTYVKNTAAIDGVGAAASANDSKTYCTLTIDGVTLTVNGNLVLGGQFSNGGYSGHTAGMHGDVKMINGAQIEVNSNGVVSALGFIYSGDDSETLVSVHDGGKVYQPFVIGDYNGGTYTIISAKKSTAPNFPFSSYGMINITTDMSMEYGSSLFGYCDLYTTKQVVTKDLGWLGKYTITIPAQHNMTTAQVLGTNNGLLMMGKGCSIHFSHGEEAVSVKSAFTKTTIEVYGDMTFGSMSMTVDPLGEMADAESIATDDVMFPVPYNYAIIQKSGKLTIPSGSQLKLMPGSEVIIDNGASMDVKGTLAIYDGSNTPKASTNFAGYAYPNGNLLREAGFEERAHLVVDGTLNLVAGSTFGGKVETNGLGAVKVDEGVSLSYKASDGMTKQDQYVYKAKIMGFTIDYPITSGHDNFTEYSLPAQLSVMDQSFVDIETGNTYFAVSDSSVEMASYASSRSGASYSVVQTVDGVWADSSDIYVVAASYNSNGKMTGVEAGQGLDYNNVAMTGNIKVYMLDSNYAPIGNVVREFSK